MHTYFSGIGGVGIGPLARIAKDMGYQVTGSDSARSRYTDSIIDDGIEVEIGQSFEQITNIHHRHLIDWFVYTAGLPDDHPELEFCRKNGIKATKRDDFINHILNEKNLKLISVAGTHGKTGTTGLLVWVFNQLGIPVSYSIGTNISFGPNGKYKHGSEFFIYEADEYDRNFLKYESYGSIITSADFDHPDTYHSIDLYKKAFVEFAAKSSVVTTWQDVAHYLGIEPRPNNDKFLGDVDLSEIKLIGEHNRKNAALALELLKYIMPETPHGTLVNAINNFPGTERRFEKLADNIYTDYAHHPTEILANIKAAKELGKDVVIVYQPHQNVRQHEIRNDYKSCFEGASKVYWLPTYLSREDKSLEVLSPEQLSSDLPDSIDVEVAKLDDDLRDKILGRSKANQLVVLMSAGDLDDWARANLI